MSGDFVSGAETSTAAIIEKQIERGHKVLIVSGSFTHPTRAKWIKIPIYDRSFFRRIANVRDLAGILRREKIDIVHAHSRAASWISYWACKFTKTAYLSTLHGRQHLHFSSRRLNVYGPQCAAVCENIREQMLEGTEVFEPDRLVVIRNGIQL